MLQSIKEIIDAVKVSKSFKDFFRGVSFVTPNGKVHFLKIKSVNPSYRGAGYRWVKYSMVTQLEYASGEFIYGYGESDVEILALQKSIAEAVERAAFILVCTEQFPNVGATTNGWAAHISPKKARASAQGELLERDAVLLHWLSQTPLIRIDDASLPKALSKWQSQELSEATRYRFAKFFISTLGNAPTASAMIHDGYGYGFISHGAGTSLEEALNRALAETCRIADLAVKGVLTRTSEVVPKTPEDHAVFYASENAFPCWIDEGSTTSFSFAMNRWTKKLNEESAPVHFAFDEYTCGPLSIARCRSRDVQDLYFGPTALNSGVINSFRIKNVSGVEKLNPLPHFVP